MGPERLTCVKSCSWRSASLDRRCQLLAEAMALLSWPWCMRPGSATVRYAADRLLREGVSASPRERRYACGAPGRAAQGW